MTFVRNQEERSVGFSDHDEVEIAPLVCFATGDRTEHQRSPGAGQMWTKPLHEEGAILEMGHFHAG